MNSGRWDRSSRRESWVLRWSFPVAIFIELTLLVIFAWTQRGAHLPHSGVLGDPKSYIEAQIYEMPETPRLTETHKAPLPPAPKAEVSLNPNAAQKSPTSQTNAIFDQKNETVEGPPIPLNHDPIPIYQPTPVLPSYLEYQDAAQTIVVLFEVSADASFHPRLVGSSGNEEIDASILEQLKRWRFKPAVRDGKPIDSRIRLQVNVVPS